MKMPLKWHEECLQGRFDTYVRLRQKADEAVEDADRCQAECAFYARQIGEARARGKDGFDAERFLVKRGRKVVNMRFEDYWENYGELHASMCGGDIKQFAKEIWMSAKGNTEELKEAAIALVQRLELDKDVKRIIGA